MTSLFPRMLAILALSACCFAQEQGTPPDQKPAEPAQANPAPATPRTPAATSNQVRIAPGSVIPAQLTKTIDAKKTKTGDPVEATVTQDLRSTNGDVILAKNTKVLGHVTEAQPRSKEQKESQLGIVFDKAVLKDAGNVPLPMTIQAVVVESNNNQSTSGAGSSSAYPPNGNASSAPSARPGMGSSTPSQPSAGSASQTADAGQQQSQRPPITAETKGVIGNDNLKLAAANSPNEGTVLSSEKNNVKLEDGTLLLLRVTP